MGDAFLYAKELRFMAAVPISELCERENDREKDEDEGRIATSGGATGVGRLGFG